MRRCDYVYDSVAYSVAVHRCEGSVVSAASV